MYQPLLRVHREILLITLICSLGLAGCTSSTVDNDDDPDPAWQLVGPAYFTLASAFNMSLAVDSSDRPWIAFTDGANHSRASVMYFDGATWVHMGTPGFTTGEAWDLSLALDSADRPWIVFTDVENEYRASVMRHDGSDWIYVGAAGFSVGTAIQNRLALDGNDQPTVCFIEPRLDQSATVMTYSDNAWSLVGTEGFTPHTEDPSLAVNSQGIPYVALQNGPVYYFNGSEWVPAGSGTYTDRGGYDPSIAFDSNDVPYVGFQTIFTQGGALVSSLQGEVWTIFGADRVALGNEEDTAIAIDHNDIPYLVYFEEAANLSLEVVRFIDGTRETVGELNARVGLDSHPLIAIGPTGSPYIAWIESVQGFKASVMVYR